MCLCSWVRFHSSFVGQNSLIDSRSIIKRNLVEDEKKALEEPDLLIAYNTSSTSLVVKWSHVPKQYLRGKPIGYKIYYISRMDYYPKTVSVNFKTNTTTLTNLRVYTRYAIAVSAVSSGGEGSPQTTVASTG